METNKNNPEKNYDLKSDAVETLANADSGEIPEYSQEELEKYRSKKGIRIPDVVKVLFIKAWFAGAVCYFFFWGLSNYIGNLIDILFVLGVALGIVTDLLTNNVIRFFEKSAGDHSKWILFPKKGYMSFIWNLLYGFAVLLGVYSLYNVINLVLVGITGSPDAAFLGVEPVLFGIFCMGIDMLFVGMKRLFITILTDARRSAGGTRNKS